MTHPHSQPTTGCLSAEDREELDAVFIAHLRSQNATLTARVEELTKFVEWVDCFVSNPVTAYSVYALDGLFGMTRDKIAVLEPKGAAV